MAQLLKITPHTIEFPLILFQSQTSMLRLENINDASVAFKIKTTAPKNYLVRPSAGVIAKAKYIDIHIILQPMTATPPTALSDRFLVQATTVEDDAPNPSKEFWMSVAKTSMWDQRLTVVFKNNSSIGGFSGGEAEPWTQNTDSTPLANAEKPHSDGINYNAVPSVEFVDGDKSAKYNEMVQTCIALETEKLALRKENEVLRQRVNQMGRQSADTEESKHSGANDNASYFSSFGFEIWHWIPIIVLIVLALKFFKFF